MSEFFYHQRRKLLLYPAIFCLALFSKLSALLIKPRASRANAEAANSYQIPSAPQSPDDFKPLQHQCFQQPYAFYRMLREQAPVYTLPNGIVCVSRFDDIVALSRDTAHFSSAHQGVVANLKPGQDLLTIVKRFDVLAQIGLIPADVLATSDPPEHTQERKVGHAGLNARFVKALEPAIEQKCSELMSQMLQQSELEFMQAFAWKLPMLMILQIIGLPAQDYVRIKPWCEAILASQSGILSSAELADSYRAALQFMDYCWRQFLLAKRQPEDNLLAKLVSASADGDSPDFSEQKAVSTIFQLIVAGSDSSATTMGNAIKILAQRSDLQQQLRQQPEQINAFIEEVFRLESAFQGHFRWVKQAAELHGQRLLPGTRIFLMWASGNRDESIWDQPDEFQLDRPKAKKHLTFGHGIHACIGRELARTEIRIAVNMLLARTDQISLNGEAPYVASMFARTLLQLPIKIETTAK